MFSSWILPVLDRLDGRALAARFPKYERTIRRQRTGASLNLRVDQRALFQNAVENMPARSKRAELSNAQIETAFTSFSTIFSEGGGPLTAFFEGQNVYGDATLEETRKFARQVDTLSRDIHKSWVSDNEEVIRHTILNFSLFSDVYWRHQNSDLDLRSEFERADGQKLKELVHALRRNVILSLIALWDIEYTTSLFVGAPNESLFLTLAPRRKVPQSPGYFRNCHYRDQVDVPLSLLVDLAGALTWRQLHGAWLNRPLSDREIARLSGRQENLAHYDKVAVSKLRAGDKRLTIVNFLDLFPAGGILVPLLVVAHLWDLLLISGSRTAVSDMPQIECQYEDFWNWHLASSFPSRAAAEYAPPPWPEYLRR